MSFFKEFKQFAMRGNVMDLAVAVVIGGAFGKIVSAFVDGIIMPIIGLILGGINLAGKTWVMGHATFKWGLFLQAVIDFALIAFSIFIIIKLINLLYKKEEAEPVKPNAEEKLLKEIRDLLEKISQQK